MNIFFTADTHFGHANVIKHDNRPFGSIYHHDDTIINNWNSTVKDGDTIYHLGDLFWNKPSARHILLKLKGKIKLIPGNHDVNWLSKKIITTSPNLEVLESIYELKISREEIYILCHYPIESWNYQRYGAKHLFGHVHGGWFNNRARACVSTNILNYTPISLDRIREHFSKI